MIAFAPLPLPPSPAPASPLQAGPEAPADANPLAAGGATFSALLAARAMPGAPVVAMSPGEVASGIETWGRTGSALRDDRDASAAPVALRFDEGPLFGRAFLTGGEFIAAAAAATEASTDANGAAVVFKASAGAMAAAPSAQIAQGIGASDSIGGSDFTTQARYAPPSAVLRDADAADRRYLLTMAGPATGAAVAPGAAKAQAQAQAQHPQPITTDSRQGFVRLALLPPAQTQAGATAASPSEAQAARARFTDRLQPVHIVLREDMAALHLTARVADMTGAAEERLERRLRDAVAQAGLALAGLRVNGRSVSAGKGKAGHG